MRRSGLLSLLIGGLLWSLAIYADSFQVAELKAISQAETYQLQAQIDYPLSDEAREALDNGVPITFEVHLQLRREGAWIWEADVLDRRLRYEIRFQALGGVYQVTNLQSMTKQRFSTEAAALKALGNLSGVVLVQHNQLTKGESYQLSMQAELDLEALPLPLRPFAYLNTGWRLQSEWKEWQLTH